MIDILMCGDNDMFPGFKAVIYSTMYHTKSSIHWHIFTMNIGCYGKNYFAISEQNQKFLTKIVKYFDGNSNIDFIDVSDLYHELLEGNKNEASGFSPYATSRLLVDKLINKHSCLYLDCDITVQDDLTDMFYYYSKQDMDYAAYTIPTPFDYAGEMVSGVIVFNIDHIKESGFLDKARKNLFLYEYMYPDQMALRDAGNPYPLQETYNYMNDLDKCCYVPKIIHYTSKLEPKVYYSEERFYRKFPFNQYILDGCELIKNILFKC